MLMGFTKQGIHRSVFRSESNIYVGAFLQKQLTAKTRKLFTQKRSIVDLRLASKYASYP